nr:MAG TPA: hypothetical protein [Caudoviricetes sp.]
MGHSALLLVSLELFFAVTSGRPALAQKQKEKPKKKHKKFKQKWKRRRKEKKLGLRITL